MSNEQGLMNDTVVVTINQNPAAIQLNKNIEAVKRFALRQIRFSYATFVGVVLPKFLYLRVRPANLINQNLVIQNVDTLSRVPNDCVPVRYNVSPAIFVAGPTQYPVFEGLQDPNTCFALENVGNLTSFTLELIDETGNAYVIPAGAEFQLIFTCIHSIPVYTSRVLGMTSDAVRRADYLNG